VTEPRDEMAAGRAGSGYLRASHADREQVIDMLKTAFAQARLTKDDFDARVGKALASRTYTELAEVTTDIPAGQPEAQRPRRPVRARARQPVNPGRKGDIRVIVAAYPIAAVSWLAMMLIGDNPAGMPFPFLALIATVVALTSSVRRAMVLVEPLLQKCFRWQLPQPPPPPAPGEW
jgi:hypothetical protein